jgi:type 1 glutamine amidotransferase
VLSLDESTYKPDGMGMDLRMGDHPIAWTKCLGKGRMFYSAIGHLPETYSHPNYVTLLENAITWTGTDKKACPAGG